MRKKHRKLRRLWWPRAGRRQGRHATITFGYQPKASGKDTGQRPWGRRPDLRAYAWQPGAGRRGARLPHLDRLALCSPRLAVCCPGRPYVGPCSPMLAVCRPRSALCWPMSALCWPYVGPSWPYLAPILALSWPYVAPSCRQILPNYVETPSTFHFFPSGAAPEPENHVKRVVFW